MHAIRGFAASLLRGIELDKTRLGQSLLRTIWTIGTRWRAIVLVVALALTFGVCLSLWRYEDARPYLAGFGAGLAALLAPLPGLVTPETRNKWIFTIGIAAIIGLGTWFSADAIEHERLNLEWRLHEQRESLHNATAMLPRTQRAEFFMRSAHMLNSLYNGAQPNEAQAYEAVLDLADVLEMTDHDNGHALFYQGEAHRALNQWAAVDTPFSRYLGLADRRPDGKTGTQEDCYLRPSGYCLERTEWIGHVKAFAELHLALGSRTLAYLDGALSDEGNMLKLRHLGFRVNGTVPSSCDLLLDISAELHKRSQPTDVVAGQIRALRAAWSMVAHRSPPCSQPA